MHKESWLMSKTVPWYTLAFVTNCMILVYEITGGRLLAPYVGTSVGVWAGLIAVVLGSMALGYHFGGRYADRNASPEKVGKVLLFASATSLLTWSMRDLVPTALVNPDGAITLQVILVAIILFAPTVMLLASISPMLAKNLLQRLDTSAKVVGELTAVGTVGSIMGAAGTGLWLIPNLGVTEILLIIPVVLFVCALPFLSRNITKYLSLIVAICALSLFLNTIPTRADEVVADISTAYKRIFVYRPGGGSVLGMADSPWGVQCAMKVDEHNVADETDVSFSYLFAYDLVVRHFFKEHIGNALFLGGCIEVFPRFILTRYPDTIADSVEIDPGVTQVARDYFGFHDEQFPTLTIHHVDARAYINTTDKKYDLIMLDVWDPSGRPVFYMVSTEAFEKVRDALAPGGIAILHINGVPSSTTSHISISTLTTAQSIFKYANVYQYKNEPNTIQNLIVVLSNEHELPKVFSDPAYPNAQLTQFEPASRGIVYTDNYAPVDGFVDWNRLIQP